MPSSPLRPGMDVFTGYQTHYVGSVVEVRYGAPKEGQESTVLWFSVRPGRINLGPLTPVLYIHPSEIRSISMERIVLVDHFVRM